jgi:hypothetical protein
MTARAPLPLEHLLWRLRNNHTAKHLCGLAADALEELSSRPPSAREETVETAYCSRLIIAAKAQAYEEAIWLVEMAQKYPKGFAAILDVLRAKHGALEAVSEREMRMVNFVSGCGESLQ